MSLVSGLDVCVHSHTYRASVHVELEANGAGRLACMFTRLQRSMYVYVCGCKLVV